MAEEIERKFLVTGDGWRAGARGVPYVQGYLSRVPERIVRIRRAGDHAYITIKGVSRGVTRKEFEYNIPVSDAEELLKLCDGPLVEKTRSVVSHAGKKWEVDEFHGENAGLILAEIELSAEDEIFDLPDWVGKEVSDDSRYYNSSLSEHPFRDWGSEIRGLLAS